jgi:hypothetical protein
MRLALMGVLLKYGLLSRTVLYIHLFQTLPYLRASCAFLFELTTFYLPVVFYSLSQNVLILTDSSNAPGIEPTRSTKRKRTRAPSADALSDTEETALMAPAAPSDTPPQKIPRQESATGTAGNGPPSTHASYQNSCHRQFPLCSFCPQ